MKLGEMLVRDGRLTEPQLEMALKYQARDGGRIGTVLFEHGLIDLEALTVYLGLELGIPIATGAMLERAKRAAVRLLQPQIAFKHKCVPLVVQDRQLLPRVAPEVRLYYYIERYYGVARPARFVKFADTARGDEGAVDAGLPAPPLPGLPPVPVSLVAAPGPRPRLRSMKMAKSFDDSEALELEAEDLIDTLDADDAAPAETAPLTPTTPIAAGAPRTRTTIPPPLSPQPLTADLAMRELATATDRNRIVEALLGYAASTFDSSVVFTVRDHLAFGWKALGVPGYAHVEHVLIPLEAPSVLQSALASENGVFHGALTPSTVNSYLFKVLGCADPLHVSAGVIAIGKRVVNILYGHGKELTPIQIGVLGQVCKSAAEAYTRLIAAKKK